MHTLRLYGDAADIGDIAYLKDMQGKQINWVELVHQKYPEA